MKAIRGMYRGLCGSVLILIVMQPFIMTAHASEGVANAGMDVIFVLDNSGSMIKNDPGFITKTAVIKFLEGLAKEVRVGMVIFDTNARLVEPLSSITTAESAEGFLDGLGEITYKGQFTNTPAGVERALYELKTNGRPAARKAIILLTDGIVDTGNREQDLESERWLKETLTSECEKRGIRIFGVAFTEDADFRLMQTLAAKTEGEYFRAFTADEVQTVFQKIDDMVSSAVETTNTALQAIEKGSPPPPEKAPVTADIKKAKAPGKEETGRALMPLLLVAVVLAGVLLIYVTFVRRKKTVMVKPDPQSQKPPSGTARGKGSIGQAELIDTENVISTESITLPLNRESVSIGRDPSNDIVIPRESISSLHATIDYKNGYYHLEDHRSTNGTRLNDKPLKENNPVRLKSGDKIHFAIYEFRFLMHDFAPYGETVMIRRDMKVAKES